MGGWKDEKSHRENDASGNGSLERNPVRSPDMTRRVRMGASKNHPTWTASHRGSAPDQMFQMPSTARREPGESGPRIGVEGANVSLNSTTRQGGRVKTDSCSKKKIGVKTRVVDEGSGASGSFFTSKQHESPFSEVPQSGQHFNLWLGVSP